ncbi:hypothetical protein I6A60_00100 [Frankia sp. AgB1.9]|uniref:hypothetical protein n=1 Tax=unclassified Frankia TaxID=2632575 RepID=UPI0019349253|nr:MULTISPECIES: hypothetical protein [unclassified Frankia]MBL7487281.1 hypothetical protein [Frankia sp. AgW1.1]MBL7546288.1 hypothetical protein [Frankia sp. AgB1.9]MBL7618667.1 hypothetical protein [Frankia sp. AgB1.8]
MTSLGNGETDATPTVPPLLPDLAARCIVIDCETIHTDSWEHPGGPRISRNGSALPWPGETALSSHHVTNVWLYSSVTGGLSREPVLSKAAGTLLVTDRSLRGSFDVGAGPVIGSLSPARRVFTFCWPYSQMAPPTIDSAIGIVMNSSNGPSPLAPALRFQELAGASRLEVWPPDLSKEALDRAANIAYEAFVTKDDRPLAAEIRRANDAYWDQFGGLVTQTQRAHAAANGIPGPGLPQGGGIPGGGSGVAPYPRGGTPRLTGRALAWLGFGTLALIAAATDKNGGAAFAVLIGVVLILFGARSWYRGNQPGTPIADALDHWFRQASRSVAPPSSPGALTASRWAGRTDRAVDYVADRSWRQVRRTIDALLWLVFGIICFVVAPLEHGFGTFGAIVIGIASLGYAGRIAFTRKGYVIPLIFYAVALIGILAGLAFIAESL